MTSVLQLIKNHWVACLCALVVVIFMVGPELYSRYTLGKDFQGIYMHASDSELMYIARMQQTYNGVSAWENPFIHEYKGQFPLPYALLADPVSAFVGKFIGIPSPELNLIYKAFFSGTIFLLIYSFVLRLVGNRLWAVATTIMIMLGYRLITVPGVLTFMRWDNAYAQFSIYSRPVTAQISWVIFWGFLHCLLSALRTRLWRYFIACGVLLGMAFYVYFYNWTFLLALLCISTIVSLVFKEKELAIKMLCILLVGVFLAVPYIYNMWAVTQNEHFAVFSTMTLLHHSREPDISKIGLSLLAMFLWSMRRRSWQIEDVSILVLLATTFAVSNQQILTSRALEVGHYHLFFNTPVYILTIFYMLWKLVARINRKYVLSGLAFVMLLSLANGLLMQSSSYVSQTDLAVRNQKYGPVLEWLNRETELGDVVVADWLLSSFISAYTHNYPYWNIYAVYYLMPPERYETSLFMYLKLAGISPTKLGSESFFHSSPSIEQLRLSNDSSNADVMLTHVLRRAYKDGMLDRYGVFYKESWEENFSIFKLDYVVWDTSTDTMKQVEKIPQLKLVATLGDLRIYQNQSHSTK